MKLRAFILATLFGAVPLVAQGTRASELLADGLKEWLRYDTQAHQAPGCEEIAPSLDSARTRTVGDVKMVMSIEYGLKRLHNQLVNCRRPISGAGAESYAKAEALFRQAYAAAPTDASAFRHLAMLLAERERWRELEILSREHLRRSGDAVWAWLALGLAQHRSGSREGAATLDTAAARMNRDDRERVFAFTRLLARPDSSTYARSAPEARELAERRFWALSDPLWSRDGDDPRTEFLARVAYAELLWTMDDPRVRGTDSDRGQIHIRYGPPQRIVAMRGSEFRSNSMRNQSFASQSGSVLMPGQSDVVTYWDYDNGLIVVFWGAPTYGTARFPGADHFSIEEIVETRSASFDNLVPERILEIPSAVTRFRAIADSVDLLLIAQAPVAAMREVTGVNARIRADVWLLGMTVPNAYRDTGAVRPNGMERRTYRVPQATYQYRVEATSDASSVAARGGGAVNATPAGDDGFATRGFGVSDVLLATVIEPPRGAPPQPRWSDFSAAPIVGVVDRGSTLQLLWENYDLSARNQQAQYEVAITVQRERSEPGRIAAAILGFAANALRIDRRDDRVISRFNRAVPASPVVVDHVSVSIGDTPPGDYRVTLEVTDSATGRKATRTTRLTIR